MRRRSRSRSVLFARRSRSRRHVADEARPALATGWSLQSSARSPRRATRLRPGFAAAGLARDGCRTPWWRRWSRTGPTPIPYFGMNLRTIPGTSYPIGEHFSLTPMPDDSPFRRRGGTARSSTCRRRWPGARVWLHFDGINYRANVWLNGRGVADATRRRRAPSAATSST